MKFKPFNKTGTWEEALIIARWPEPVDLEGWEEEKADQFALVQEIIRAIRNMRAEKKVTPGKRIPATFVSREKRNLLSEQMQSIAALAYLDPAHIQILDALEEKLEGQTTLVLSGVEIYLPLADLVDQNAERIRLEKELATIESEIIRLDGLLASPFGQKAPPQVIEKERQKLDAYHETARKIKQQLQA